MVQAFELAAFALGFLALGIGGGLVIYHFGHGWFIAHTSREHLEGAVEEAQRLLLRRAARRHEREAAGARRDRQVEGERVSGGRHLAR